jgi:hypothetical protein
MAMLMNRRATVSRQRTAKRRREGLLVLPIRRYGSPPPLCLWGEETEKGRLASAAHTAEEEETCLPPQKQ